jgi:putative CocE/NonD family hydrolase
MVAATSLYHEWMTLNGGWHLSFNFGWGPVRQESRIMQNTGPHIMAGGPDAINFDKLQRHLPLNDMQALAGRNAQFYKDWLLHPDYDDYWKKLNAEEVMDKISVPAHTFGGWFDIFSQGSIRGYALLSKKGATEAARKQSNMMMGPWGHGSSPKFGDLEFPSGHVDTHALELRWYDFHLKGLKNGLDQEPPVKLYVMGRNEWVLENEYPLARTQYKKMFLQPGAKLSWNEPADDAKADSYRYDPDNPVPSLGWKQLLRHAYARRAEGSAAARFARRHPALYVRVSDGAGRSDGAGEGGAACGERCARHGFCGEADRRVSGWPRVEHGRGHHSRAVSRRRRQAEIAGAGQGV